VSTLTIRDLRAAVDGFEILRGVDLEIRSGEVHALMGPNGSGKSTLAHVLMGRDDYDVTAGSVTIDGIELLKLPTWQRAVHGLFLAMQYPVEVPGVTVGDLVNAAVVARGNSEATVDMTATLGEEAMRLAASTPSSRAASRSAWRRSSSRCSSPRSPCSTRSIPVSTSTRSVTSPVASKR
jgi:Fe-S cluster assembly ATP-binding protein